MTFEQVVDQALAMLQRRGRGTYRLLKRQFSLDDEALEDLKCELIEGQRRATDENGTVLVWTGHAVPIPEPASAQIDQHPVIHDAPTPAAPPPTACILQTPNAASSPCSSVTWLARRRSRRSSTPKTCGRWCVPHGRRGRQGYRSMPGWRAMEMGNRG
jgi:hypothetical protein